MDEFGSRILTKAPDYGRQTVRFLSGGALIVIGQSRTIKRLPSETADDFIARLARLAKPEDEVEIIYQGGLPQYAVIRFAAFSDG